MTPIYLDYNASTPLLPEALDAMLPFLRDHFGNAFSTHTFGRASRDAVEKARQPRARASVAYVTGSGRCL